MSAADFTAWLAHLGLSDAEAAKLLGLPSKSTVQRYQLSGAPVVIGLACAALAFGLPTWRDLGRVSQTSTTLTVS